MDKPYVERTGGAYEADPKTGQLKRTEPEIILPGTDAGEPQPTPSTAPAPAPALPDDASVKTRTKGD